MPANPKEMMTVLARAALRVFLDSGCVLHMPRPAQPRLSILLVLYNRAELTLACLQSLLAGNHQVPFEVVVVDNASTDETAKLLERIEGITVVRNAVNVGFPEGVNQAASQARGEFLLLLNNDTQVLGRSLDIAVEFLGKHADVGAVGGRIILLDGSLQEAGCGLWRDASPLQYGRGEDPFAPEYLFQRDVDYCSGAFLMTRRTLFAQLGGLDLAFAPAYYEDPDYCVRLWRLGWRVVYLPGVAILHYENASSQSPRESGRLSHRNHILFTLKHAEWLSLQSAPGTAADVLLRSSHDDRIRVLYLFDAQATAPIDDGAPNTERMIGELAALNCFVTVYPLGGWPGERPRGVGRLPLDVEVLEGGQLEDLPAFLASRHGYYDAIYVTDPALREPVRRVAGAGLRILGKGQAGIDFYPSRAGKDTPADGAKVASTGLPGCRCV